jgi:ribose transport system substrate-binding protein
MRIHRFPASVFLLPLLFLSACQRSSSEAEKPEIALVMKSLANEFFQSMADGARDHQAAHSDDYDLIVNGIKNETDLGQQVSLVEQMVARGVDAIVIAPADSKALIPVLRRAQEAGVLVINIDNKLDAETLHQAGLSVPFVGPDNRAGAREVGLELSPFLKPGDPVAIIEGIPTAFNSQQRRLGYVDAMAELQARLVSVQAGNWEMAKANAVAASLLTAHPDLKAILCANDSMALGAVAAIRSAGRTDVRVVGFDNISAISNLIEEGIVVATADQHGEKLAVFGIESALAIIEGEQAPEDRLTEIQLITRNDHAAAGDSEPR